MEKLTTKQAREALDGKADDVEYTVKHHTIYRLEGGELYKIWKPSISSTICYSDEHDSPLAGKGEDGKREAFIAYNMRSMQGICAVKWLEWRDELHRTGCASGKFLLTPMMCDGRDGCVRVGCRAYDGEAHEYDISNRIRDLSREEMEDVAECERDAMHAYEKRLNTYWKRYSRNVLCSAYWADR